MSQQSVYDSQSPIVQEANRRLSKKVVVCYVAALLLAVVIVVAEHNHWLPDFLVPFLRKLVPTLGNSPINRTEFFVLLSGANIFLSPVAVLYLIWRDPIEHRCRLYLFPLDGRWNVFKILNMYLICVPTMVLVLLAFANFSPSAFDYASYRRHSKTLYLIATEPWVTVVVLPVVAVFCWLMMFFIVTPVLFIFSSKSRA